MESFISDLEASLPAVLDWISVSKQTLIIAGAFLVLALLFRGICGKLSDFNQALSSSIGILLLLTGCVALHVYGSASITELLPPLPYAEMAEDELFLFNFMSQERNMICYQILSCVILAFWVNLLDALIPQGKTLFGWFILRLLSQALALVCYGAVNWIINAFVPVSVLEYAPMILLIVLAALLLLGILKLILGVALTAANPIIGAIYAFFFAHRIGKQISKSILTTITLTALVLLLGHYGYTVFSISEEAMSAYIPIPVVMLLVWYLTGHIL